ncbi:MAG: hypothetical protein P1U74_05045 [Legionellaceae bacterium]|nr:hypothetical protein [Legionellaceae bacterium]
MPKKICISGCNLTDGMGDLAHIINIGRKVQDRYADSAEVVYEFQWLLNGSRYEDIDKGRVKELLNRLLSNDIISSPVFDYNLSAEQMIERVNDLNSDKVHILTAKNIYKDFKPDSTNISQKERFADADLWIVSSVPAFGEEARHYHLLNQHLNIGLGTPGKTIFCLEHCGSRDGGLSDPSSCFKTKPSPEDEEGDVFYSPTDKLVMGFGDAKEKTMAGILLDKSELPTSLSKIKCILEIKNHQFHGLLHGETELSIESAKQIEKQTIFVPNYHSHGQEHALKMFLNFYTNTLKEDDRDIFMQGKFELQEFINKSEELIAAGFTDIEYFDKQAGEIKKIPLEDCPSSKSKKTLKVFTGRLDDDDYNCFKQCANIVSGCSGDNTLQDAINTGAVPLFTPNKGKAKVMVDLKQLLESEEEGTETYAACIKFLSMYERFSGYKNLSEETYVYTPELLTQWQAVCLLLKEHHNTYDTVYDRVEQKLGISPKNEGSNSSSIDESKAQFNSLKQSLSHIKSGDAMENPDDEQEYSGKSPGSNPT